MQLLGPFYGFEQRTNVNRLFKIYVTDEGLFGGWIAPCDHEEMLARFTGNALMNQNIAGMRQIAASAEKWEQHLDAFVPGDAEFLAAHKENFAFSSSQTKAALTWKLKVLERASTRFGALDLTPEGGKKRRFYLVGRRTPDEVAAMLRSAFPQLQLEGQPAASNPFAPLQNASEPHLDAPTEPVRQPVKWLPLMLGWGAAISVSLVLASQFHFWWGLAACVLAPQIFRMVRFADIARNGHANSVEQLRRDRAAKDRQN